MKTDLKAAGEPVVVHARQYTFAAPPGELVLESGQRLGPITLAYETCGTLNDDGTNAILVLHALTGDAHVAGLNSQENAPGWWDDMIGPGKALDTDKYFVICSNVLGGCRGSTGPSSINPQTGKPYGGDFPSITIGDMVNAQERLLDHLGIGQLLSAVGGSMGGMQVLEWLVSHPNRIRSAIPIATALRHSPQQIAFNEVGRQAIVTDPNWKGGHYYDSLQPAHGLAVARMVGHITYMSDISMQEKFGRKLKSEGKAAGFAPEFEVEGYLNHRGQNFVKRFDANSYLYITKALDYFDALKGRKPLEALKGNTARVLVVAFKSDWLYPLHQSQEIVRACKVAGMNVSYCEIDSTYGHDAFLLETKEETHLIKYFLEKVYCGETSIGNED